MRRLADGDTSLVKLSQELGISRGSVKKYRDKMLKAGLVALDSQQEPNQPTRVEVHDATFWRKKFRSLEKELGIYEKRLEQLAGLRQLPFNPPEWLLKTHTGRRGRSVIGMLVSDVHMGETINGDELAGVNEFNMEICRKRMERYFQAACIIGRRWAEDTECQGAILALAGDLTSGDIHEELRITNDLTSTEQVIAVAEVIEPGIAMALETYGRVHVVGTPGNHGRTTAKPTAKLYARLNYDNLVLSILEQRFENDDRVTFQYGPAKDQITPVFGRTIFTTHGDKIGTRGGMGFAGPVLPIVRGSKKIEAEQAGMGRRPDLIQFGHYHTSANPGNILANGSVPGYSEYASDIRAGMEPPQQWLYLLHSRWWLRERAEIQLEEPEIPDLPRVRVPAEMR